MSVKLQNRRDVEAQLQKFLDKMVLPPDMVATLTGKDVNDAYVEYLLNLNAKIAYVGQAAPAADGSSLDLAPSETQAGKDLAPKLERLRLRAVRFCAWRVCVSWVDLDPMTMMTIHSFIRI